MRALLAVAIVAFAAGALLWTVAAVTALGSITGQSSDPAQTARVVAAVPEWVSSAKTIGLVVMGFALVAGGAAWLMRRSVRRDD